MVFKPQATTNRLKVLRAERHVSQRAVAVEAGIQFDRYWRIENGYAEAAVEERRSIAKVMGVPMSAIWPAAQEVTA